MKNTGTIVMYIGPRAPEGWLFCNGKDIPEGEQFDDLRSLIGDTLPSLASGPMAAGDYNWPSSRGVSRGSNDAGQGPEAQPQGAGYTNTQMCHSTERPASPPLWPPLRYIIKY